MLVGREGAVGVGEAVLGRVSEGESCSLAIIGDPGIGKTAFLGELLLRSRARGHLVLEGRATEFEGDSPLAPFLTAFGDELVRSGAPADGLGTELAADLSRVLPEVADGPGPGLLHAERWRGYRAVLRWLELSAVERPLVLAIDDAQWADEASLELLAHLLLRPPRAAVLLVVSFRPRQAPRLLSASVAQALRDGAGCEVRLGPLREAEAAELLGEDVNASTRASLYREAGGNPFYLSELARAARAGREDVLSAGAGGDAVTPVPSSVRAALRGEIEALPREARALIEAAAVLGDPVDADLAAEVAELEPAGARGALEALVAQGLLAPAGLPRQYAFRHPIVRTAVDASLPEPDRFAAHRRAASALEGRGVPVVRRARHVAMSAQCGDEAAPAVLEQAAREVAPRMPAVAARWFGAALELLPAEADAGQRAGLLLARAQTLGDSGRVAEAIDALSGVLDTLPRELGELRVRVAGYLARSHHTLGDVDSARRALDQALPDAPAGTAARCALLVQVAIDHWLRTEWDAMAETATEALELADALGNRVLALEAAAALTLAETNRGPLERCEGMVDRAMTTLRGLSDTELALALATTVLLLQACFYLGRYDDAAYAAERGLGVARMIGNNHVFAAHLTNQALADLWQGRLADAEGHVVAGIEAAEQVGNEMLRTGALAAGSQVSLAAGDLEIARERALAASAASGEPGSPYGWYAHGGLAMVLLGAGEAEAARTLMLERLGGPQLAQAPLAMRGLWLSRLALAEVECGRLADAELTLERAGECLDVLPVAPRVGESLLARGVLALARGEAEAAAGLASEGRPLFRLAGQALDEGRALWLAGRARRVAGDDEAAELLGAAWECFEACGAAGLRAEAHAELRALGREPPGRPRLAALSEREREVALLVARGLSNKAIAAELYLSRKTVEAHLSRIYRRLGLRSRSALAALVEREGADETARSPLSA